jgi:hypothetical protein
MKALFEMRLYIHFIRVAVSVIRDPFEVLDILEMYRAIVFNKIIKVKQ